MTPLPPVRGRLLAAWIPAAGLELAAAVTHAAQITGYVRVPYTLAVREAGCTACRAQLRAAVAVLGGPVIPAGAGRWIGVALAHYGPGEEDVALAEAITVTDRVAEAVAMVAALGGCWACSELAAIL